MMTRVRADLGFSNALDGFDPADWGPDPARTSRPKPAPDTTRAVAAQTGFRSREAGQGGPVPATPKPVRRRRTGRNAQFNLKARPDTIAAFCAVADAQGWGLGETLEHAVALLQREHGGGQQG